MLYIYIYTYRERRSIGVKEAGYPRYYYRSMRWDSKAGETTIERWWFLHWIGTQ